MNEKEPVGTLCRKGVRPCDEDLDADKIVPFTLFFDISMLAVHFLGVLYGSPPEARLPFAGTRHPGPKWPMWYRIYTQRFASSKLFVGCR